MNRGSVIARWRWCWAWALAILCLHPTAARAGALWSPASPGDIDEALRRVKLQRLRGGMPADAEALEALREGSALVVQRSRRCPAELKVINASGHAMWHVRVAVSGLTGGKQVERAMHLPILPAGSKATVEFPCSLWGAGGAPIAVTAPPAVPGPALGPDVMREMLATNGDHHALTSSFLARESPFPASSAAFALEYLLSAEEQGLQRELIRLLPVAPEGAEILITRLFRRDQALLDVDKVVAAARDGKVDVVAAMELDRTLRVSCGGSARSLRSCAKAIKEHLGDGAGDMLAPAFFANLDGELKRLLPSESDSATLDLLGVLPELRAIGLKTAPIAQLLCEQAIARPDVTEDLLALAAQIEPGASCMESSRRTLLRMSVQGKAIEAGKLFVVLLPVLVAALVIRLMNKRVRVKLGLGSEAPATQGPAPGGVIGPRLDTKAWARSFEAGVEELRRGLDAEGSEPCRAASAAIGRAMTSDGASIAEVARGAAIDALRGGELQSVLARLGGLLFYVLVVPSARPEPKALVQHAALADGWAGHARRVAAGSPALAGAKLPVLSLILFVRPDASEVALVAGYDDGERRVWPGPLLAAGEARRVEGRVYPDHHEFNLAPA